MRNVLTVAVIIALAFACGGEPKAPPQNECGQHAKPAVDKVNAVIENNRACSTDGDCVDVPIHSDCFDACSASIAKSGRAAVEQALASASANECKAFTNAGCQVLIPPCVPPSPPTCREGKCL